MQQVDSAAAHVRPVEDCPVCRHAEREHIYRDPRYREDQNRDIVACLECGMHYVSPLVMQDYRQIPLSVYENDIWNQTAPYVLNLREQFRTMEAGLRLLSPEVLELPEGQRNLLEIGCGLGYFLDIGRARGWNTVGLEIWQSSVDWSRRYLGLDVRNEPLDEADLPANAFHAIAMIEVLEHLEQPRDTLFTAWDLLHPQGMLFLTVPNFGSLHRVKEGWDWDVIDPYGHIQYFTMNTLYRCARMAGFGNIVIAPTGGETDDKQLRLFARKVSR